MIQTDTKLGALLTDASINSAEMQLYIHIVTENEISYVYKLNSDTDKKKLGLKKNLCDMNSIDLYALDNKYTTKKDRKESLAIANKILKKLEKQNKKRKSHE